MISTSSSCLDLIKTPESLVNYLKGFEHDFRYSTSLSRVNFDYVVDQYFSKGNLPSFTFLPSKTFLESGKGSCYDVALLSCRVLSGLGYKCDILHLGWTPRDSSSLGILSCMHAVCRFWSGTSWFTLHGFLYKDTVRLLGPFYSVDDFVKEFSSIIRKFSGRSNSNITFIDSLQFFNKEVPTFCQGLFPVKSSLVPLGYWVV